jgi:hypothetical protein
LASCPTAEPGDRQPRTDGPQKPVDDGSPFHCREVKGIEAVIGSVEIEHHAEDREPGVPNPGEESFHSRCRETIDGVDDGEFRVGTLSNGFLDFLKVISPSFAEGVG